MRLTAASREVIRRAGAAVALLALVLHVGLSGVGATARAVDQPRRPAHAAHMHGHGDRPAEPAAPQNSKHHHMGSCVLCGALGTAVGPPPASHVVERIAAAPEPVTFVEIAAAFDAVRSACLPVGARAPPRSI